MPAMVGRSFGYIVSENYELRESVSKMRDSKKEFMLGVKQVSLTDIAFGNLRALKEREYLSVLTHFVVKYKKNLPILYKEFNEISTEKGDYEEKFWLPFWLFKDRIIFSSAQQSRDYLVPFLNDALNQDIRIPQYNVQQIYDDFEPQDRVWGFGFMKRPDAISSGQLYGEVAAADPLVQQLENSSKNFCAINLPLHDIELKIAVYSVGTIVVHKNWAKMNTYKDKFKEIQKKLETYEVLS